MHPILARKRRLLSYLAATAPLGAVLTVLLARPGAYSLAQAAAVAFPLGVIYAFLGLSAWYPCRSLPLSGTKAPLLLVSHGVAALLTSAVWVLLGAGMTRLLDLVPDLSGMAEGYAAQVPPLFAVGFLLYLLLVALHYVLLAFETARDAERPPGQFLSRVVVKDGPHIRVIPVEKLDFAEAQDDSVCLKTEGKKYRKAQTLASLSETLDPARFLRVHRSYVINLDHLQRVELYAKNSHVAILADGARVPVSREGHARLRELLEGRSP